MSRRWNNVPLARVPSALWDRWLRRREPMKADAQALHGERTCGGHAPDFEETLPAMHVGLTADPEWIDVDPAAQPSHHATAAERDRTTSEAALPHA